jgi:hypothetical protein
LRDLGHAVRTPLPLLLPRWTLADPIGGRASGRYYARGQSAPSNIENRSSISLVRGAASIENSFAPYKGRDRYGDHENQGEPDAYDGKPAAIHASRISANYAPPHSSRPATQAG